MRHLLEGGAYLRQFSNNSGNLLKLAFFASPFLYISDITFQRVPLFSNSEVNISAAPWSSFYAFIDILSTNQA